MAAAHEASHPIINGALQDEQVLLDAGSNPSLLQLSVTNESDKAPIELLGEFLRCLMNEEYEAAKVLCKKVLELESNNTIAQEFISTIEERIQLDEELDTESDTTSSYESTDNDSPSIDSNSSDSNDNNNDEEHRANCNHSNCNHSNCNHSNCNHSNCNHSNCNHSNCNHR